MNTNKSERLFAYLWELDSVLVCFSGGVDSSLLLAAAAGEFHNKKMTKAEAVFFNTAFVPKSEQAAATEFAKSVNIPLNVIDVDVFAIPTMSFNPENRCYICKFKLLSEAINYAASRGIGYVIEGSNAEDLTRHRPGRQAVKELGVKSPLEYAGFYKSDVRDLARQMGLAVWNKPSFSCLMTKFPHGTEVTGEMLY